MRVYFEIVEAARTITVSVVGGVVMLCRTQNTADLKKLPLSSTKERIKKALEDIYSHS